MLLPTNTELGVTQVEAKSRDDFLDFSVASLVRLREFYRGGRNKLYKTARVAGSLAIASSFLAISSANASTATKEDRVGNIITAQKDLGVVTDIAERDDPVEATKAISIVKNAGFTSLTETVWIPPGSKGFKGLSAKDQMRIKNSLDAATEQNLPIHLYMWQEGWVPGYKIPTSPTEQTMWCRLGGELVRDYSIINKVSVGVEWNNPAFAHPQFIDGADAVAQPYVSLLSSCYQQIHNAADQRGVPVVVIGGELAPAGNDDSSKKRPSHSPITEIANMCRAYSASRRGQLGLPIMDEFGMHFYAQPGETGPIAHPNTNTVGVGDYDKLRAAISCFSPLGSGLPPLKIGWTEGGIATEVPPGHKGYRPPLPYAVPEEVQGQFVTQAIKEFVCHQPQAVEYDNFGLIDDGSALSTGYFYALPASARQSSLNTAVLKPKSSFKAIHSVMIAAENSTLCNQ